MRSHPQVYRGVVLIATTCAVCSACAMIPLLPPPPVVFPGVGQDTSSRFSDDFGIELYFEKLETVGAAGAGSPLSARPLSTSGRPTPLSLGEPALGVEPLPLPLRPPAPPGVDSDDAGGRGAAGGGSAGTGLGGAAGGGDDTVFGPLQLRGSPMYAARASPVTVPMLARDL